METLIIKQPGKRELTEAGRQAFINAYQTGHVLPGEQPVIRFDQQAVQAIREISDLRKRDWVTTTRWNEAADFTGLIGELAVQKFFAIPAQEALETFLQGLKGSDNGIDVVWAGHGVDVKSTQGEAQRFKFNKTNRHRNEAQIIAFCRVGDIGHEVWVRILGWAWKHKITPYLRDDGLRFVVRFSSLLRDAVAKPIRLLNNTVNVNSAN